MIDEGLEKKTLAETEEHWPRWYTLVLVWHAIVIFMMFLFTQKFHP